MQCDKAHICNEILARLQSGMKNEMLESSQVHALLSFILGVSPSPHGNWAKMYGLDASKVVLKMLLRYKITNCAILECLRSYGMPVTGDEIPDLIHTFPTCEEEHTKHLEHIKHLVRIVAPHYTADSRMSLLTTLLDCNDSKFTGSMKEAATIATLRSGSVNVQQLELDQLLTPSSPSFIFLLTHPNILDRLFQYGATLCLTRESPVQQVLRSAVSAEDKAAVLTCLLDNGCSVMDLQSDTASPIHVATEIALKAGTYMYD